MLVVGLTGGIGSGKSTIAKLFKELGVDVIDTDLIARDVVMPGTEALKAIAAHFDKKVIKKDGTLNRRVLREKIFNAPDEKKWLENLLHPLISQETKDRISKAQSPYCIIVIPLLFESKKIDEINRIVVVDTTEMLQIERTMARDNCTRDMVLKMMATQVSRAKRLSGADDIILNSRDLTYLRSQILKLHDKLLKIVEKSAG